MYQNSLHAVVKRLYNFFNMSVRNISNFIGISKSTVQRWIHLTTSEIRKTRIPKYSFDFTSLFASVPTMSLRDFIHKYNLTISKSWLSILLHQNEYVHKKVYPCGSLNFENIQKQRDLFSEKVKSIEENNVISIDETSYYHNMNPLKAWVKIGSRFHVPYQRKASKRYTLVTAISNSKLVHEVLFEGSCNTKRFLEFLEGIEKTKCTEKYLFLDNVSFHKSKSVIEQYNKMNKIPIFVSPYSPEWNPVEFHFSSLKSQLRKRMFQNNVIHFSDDHYSNIFSHVFKDIKNKYHR